MLFSKRKTVPSTPFSEFIRNASSAEKKKVYAQVLKGATERQNELMSRRDIHVIPHGDGWATRSEGASRVGSTAATQRDAINLARSQAQRRGVDVVIHRADGRIRDSDSYRADPSPPESKRK